MNTQNLPDFKIEKRYLEEFDLIIGIDEAGRGPIAGPLTVAAISIKPKFFKLPFIFKRLSVNDSKKLSPQKREKVRKKCIRFLKDYKIVHISNKTIDKKGVSKSFKMAVRKIEEFWQSKYSGKKLLFLVDFYKVKSNYTKTKFLAVKKGDEKSISIALASIFAKTERDNLMIKLHQSYPNYLWNKNKGYATREHIEAIEKFGFSPYHRKSFVLKKPLKK